MDYKEFYGTAEIAEILGINRMKLNRLIRHGYLRALAVGTSTKRKTYIIPRRALLEFLGEFDWKQMTLDEITRAIEETYGITKTDTLSGKIKPSDLANVIKTTIENQNDGVFYFPDALTDTKNKRKRKADQRKTVFKFIQTAQNNNLTLFKFRQFIPSTAKDSVYSPRTIEKARTLDGKTFKKTPRIMRLEKAGGRNGDFHLQGLVALPEGDYPIENYERLDYREIEQGVKEWVAYLSKPADARLERDMGTHKLCNPFEVALLGVAEWYTQSLRNRRNGIKRNPRTMWSVL